ncbi:Holliday junction resolvase, partial [bacterium]
QQVGQMVKYILGINGEIPPDATDALATAICYLQREYG